MKPINKDELYQNLHGFLKTKGVELQEGSYAHVIEKSCHLLADAINLGQAGLGRAKVEIDKKLDQMRQVIHEKTAPKSKPQTGPASAPNPTPAQSAAPGPKTAARKTPPRRPRTKKTRKSPRHSH